MRLGLHNAPFLPYPLILPRPLPHGQDTLNLTAIGMFFQVASHVAQRAKPEPGNVGCSKDMGVFGATRGRTRAQPSKDRKANGCLLPPSAQNLHLPLSFPVHLTTKGDRSLPPCTVPLPPTDWPLMASRQKTSAAKLESNQPRLGTECHSNMAAGTSP